MTLGELKAHLKKNKNEERPTIIHAVDFSRNDVIGYNCSGASTVSRPRVALPGSVRDNLEISKNLENFAFSRFFF